MHAGYVRDPTLKAAHRRSRRDGAPLQAAKGMLLMVTLLAECAPNTSSSWFRADAALMCSACGMLAGRC